VCPLGAAAVAPSPCSESLAPQLQYRCTESARIAVVGSGIAGLSVAYLLTQSPLNHRVVVYEASPRLGMDSHGVDLPAEFVEPSHRHPDGLPTRVDVPLRVFTESYYPHLTGLYNNVGVEYQPENYESSFTDCRGNTIFAYKNLIFKGLSLPYLLPWPLGNSPVFSLDFWRITRDILYFYYNAPKHLTNGRLRRPTSALQIHSTPVPYKRSNSNPSSATGGNEAAQQGTETFLQYLEAERYSEPFIYRFMIPIVAAICTCSQYSAGQYPAWIIVQYLVTRAWKGVRRVRGGARDVVSKLVAKCEAVHLNSPVRKIVISQKSDDTATQVQVETMGGQVETFDHVIFASQANQTLRILNNSEDRTSVQPGSQDVPPPAPQMRAALAGIPYETSRLVLHTDPSLMPKRRQDWRSVNMILPESGELARNFTRNPIGSADRGGSAEETKQQDEAAMRAEYLQRIEAEGMATIWMNRVQHGLSPDKDIFQTWNPIHEPAEGSILSQTVFERPVVTYESLRATEALWAAQGEQGIWCVGSYSLCGVPLLETAVHSAVKVGDAFGADCPWKDAKFEEATKRAQGELPPSASSRLVRWSIKAVIGTGVAVGVAFALKMLRSRNH